MRKITSVLLIIVILLSFLSGCRKYPKSVKTELTEGVDYIDHSSTYAGEGLTYDETKWYVNELKDVPLPDPQVYFEDGTYYIVGTSDRGTGGKYGIVVDCYTTEDFVNYEEHRAIYDPAKYDGWEAVDSKDGASIYAPELYCFDGVYYMYYSAIDAEGIRRNSVVVANNPLGPYKPLKNSKVNGEAAPIFRDKNDRFDALDITIFVDDDEEMYMYYSVQSNENQHIVGVKMNSPYEADWSTYKELVIPGALSSSNFILKPLTWETFRAGNPIAEAPYMIKSGGKYYLTYSVNGCWDKYYNVCYAVSDSPLGNFEKPYQPNGLWTNLLLGYPGTKMDNSTVYNQWIGFASGTGHHCFFEMGDQIMIGYHAHKSRMNNDQKYTRRYFAFDYLHFDENGVPFCNGPTYSVQPLPEYISGYKNIAPLAEVKSDNVTNAKAINDNYIVDCYNLKGEEQKEVSMGNGYSYIELIFDDVYEIGGIAIYNSAYYNKFVSEIEYIDFGNGNTVLYPQFCAEQYVNEETEFVFPSSAITIEFMKNFEADRVVICVKTEAAAALNEIVILGK